MLPAMKALCSYHWTAREVLMSSFNISMKVTITPFKKILVEQDLKVFLAYVLDFNFKS